MFVGRKRELSALHSLSASTRFEYLVLYGRRRVGKTTLLLEFMKTQPVIFYAAQAKNDALNLVDFSKAIHQHYDSAYYAPFSDWQAAFSYIGEQDSERRTIVVIDEFPYIAETNPTIQSILQHTIDHRWKEKNIFLILCGSSVSFMENEVMGSKSPLFGRSTAILELKGFDYLESSHFFPTYDVSDKLLSYAILGGIPTYLQAFDPKKSIQSNIAERILRMGAFLNNEPQNLLKMEIRESAVYNAILEAIATGSSRLNEIAQKIKEEPTKCSKYLSVLMNLKIVERITPSGEKESSKRSLYTIADNFFQFWYRFIFPNRSYYELIGEERSALSICQELSSYMGGIFEKICTEYLIRMAKSEKLPFIFHTIGRWWGGNPTTKKEADIDILAFDKSHESALFAECKFRTKQFSLAEYHHFLNATAIIKEPTNRHYYIFSKGGYTNEVKEQAAVDRVTLVNLDDFFYL